MITKEHTAVIGGGKDCYAPQVGLYVDHLTPGQLRQRAANDRADALALAGKLSAASVAMLLNDAAQCEVRAALLEMDAADSRFWKGGDGARGTA
ncbi:hypothetical protein ABNQ39_11555 [Azospirillum sp. A26]|uniref:hypothetical protein n=1 Tax=Azospirillum sp. A26 TaxID=3160607 RepID=UPI00366BF971